MPIRQRGQALVFIVITTVIVLLGALALFNIAQLTTQKMKLQNTADAAAYSGALSEARDYNFTAYANRAMIANQVAVAQLLGLTSWARNLDSVYKSGPFTWVPQTFSSLSALGSLWNTQWNIAKPVANAIYTVLNNVGPVLVKALNFWIDALSLGTSAYHMATMLEVWLETVPTVISENDPNSKLSTSLTQIGFGIKHAKDYWDFTSQYDPQVSNTGSKDYDSDRQTNVVFNSQDGFYNFRSYPWPLPLLIDPTKLIPGNFGTLFMMMYHSGGTEMKDTVSNKKSATWAALDATGLFVILMVWIFVPFPVPIPIPLPLPQGYGAAYCGTGSGSSLLQPGSNNLNHNFAAAFGSTFVNPLTMAPGWIKVGEGPGSNVDNNCGLKKYWDVTNRAQASSSANQNINGADLLIEVEKEVKHITLSSSTGAGGGAATPMRIGGDATGRLYLADGTQDSKLKALSKAHAYFSRPNGLFARDDGKTEYGSLYNPYWQAKLLPNSLIEQGFSILGQALP